MYVDALRPLDVTCMGLSNRIGLPPESGARAREEAGRSSVTLIGLKMDYRPEADLKVELGRPIGLDGFRVHALG